MKIEMGGPVNESSPMRVFNRFRDVVVRPLYALGLSDDDFLNMVD